MSPSLKNRPSPRIRQSHAGIGNLLVAILAAFASPIWAFGVVDRTQLLDRIDITSSQLEHGTRFKLGAPSALSANEEPNIDGEPFLQQGHNSAGDSSFVGDDLATLLTLGDDDGYWHPIMQNCQTLILDSHQITEDGFLTLFHAMGQGQMHYCRIFGITAAPDNTKLNLRSHACNALQKGALLNCEILELTGTLGSIGFYQNLVRSLEHTHVLPRLRYLYLGGIDREAQDECAGAGHASSDTVMQDLANIATKRGIRWNYIYP